MTGRAITGPVGGYEGCEVGGGAGWQGQGQGHGVTDERQGGGGAVGGGLTGSAMRPSGCGLAGHIALLNSRVGV